MKDELQQSVGNALRGVPRSGIDVRRTSAERHGGRSLQAYAALLVLLAAGCSSQNNAATLAPSDAPRPAAPELEIVREGGRPVAVKAEDGIEIAFERGEAMVGDWIVIEHGDGRIEQHRAPTAIMTEASRLPYLYLDQETGEQVQADGHCGTPYIHPETGRICWPALTCTNPACDSQNAAEKPYLFMFPLIAGASVGADGKIVVAPGTPSAPAVPPCPICNSKEFVTRYELPAEVQRREQLAGELKRVRTARNEALKSRRRAEDRTN